MQAQHIARGLLASVGAVVLTSAFAISTFAASATPTTGTVSASSSATTVSNAGTVVGTPAIGSGSPLGYYIYVDPADNRVHVATHGPGDEHEFVARLHSDKGTFENIDASKLESGDSYKLLDGGHTLVLDFHTYAHTDDIAFNVKDGKGMELDLKLDGSPIDTGSIYLGPNGRHPATNPFRIKL